MRKEYCRIYESVYFYASSNNNWVRLSDTDKNVNKDRIPTIEEYDNPYKDQIGYIYCKIGFIEKVWVNGDKDPQPARRCGMATVFSTLCMMDEEVNLHDELKSNGVPGEIQDFFNYNQPLQQFIKKECKRFVGLEMLVEPLRGSHPYSLAYACFSAAIKSGYNKIFMRNNGAHVTDELTDYIWRNTDDAKAKYDATTGNVGGVVGKGKNWWFCDFA